MTMSSNDSISDDQCANPGKARVARWFKSFINIVRSRSKGGSKVAESTTDMTVDSSSDINVVINSIDVVSPTVTLKVDSPMTRRRPEPSRYHRVQPPTPLFSPTSTYYVPRKPRAISSPRTIHYNSPVDSFIESSCKFNAVNPAIQRGSRLERAGYSDFGSSEPQAVKGKISLDSTTPKHEPSSQPISKSDSRKNKVNKRSFLMAIEKDDSQSLHYGEVSPKKFVDTFEPVKKELYGPIKRVRMEEDDAPEQKADNENGAKPDNSSQSKEVQDEEEIEPQKQIRRFGVLPFEETHDMQSCPLAKEMETLFFNSRKLVREIYGTLSTIKDWKDFLRDRQFLIKNLDKVLESFQSMKKLVDSNT